MNQSTKKKQSTKEKQARIRLLKQAGIIGGLGIIGYYGYWAYRRNAGTWMVLEAVNGRVRMNGKEITPDFMATYMDGRTFDSKVLFDVRVADYDNDTMVGLSTVLLVIAEKGSPDMYEFKMSGHTKDYMKTLYKKGYAIAKMIYSQEKLAEVRRIWAKILGPEAVTVAPLDESQISESQISESQKSGTQNKNEEPGPFGFTPPRL